MEIPTVRSVMHTPVFTIGAQQTLIEAAKRMRDHGCRHLPVLVGGRVRGILSDRDIDLVLSLPGIDGTELTVEEAMVTDPFTVSPDSNLADTLSEMATHKYGAAVVTDGQQVVGIFTTVDAMAAFAAFLRKHSQAA